MCCPPRGSAAPARAALCVLVALVAPAVVADAETRRVPADFASITAALEASAAGDSIVVGAGTWRESLLFTEAKGSGVTLRSADGADVTTIAYGDSANPNEAVVTLQRCADSTRIVGFTIDGRDVARRGVLVSSESLPALRDLVIQGAEFGVAVHRGSSPDLRNVTAVESRVAGLFVDGAAATASDCRFAGGAGPGVALEAGTGPITLRNVEISDNARNGLQSVDCDVTIERGLVARNGESGIVLRRGAGVLRGVRIEGHPNVGIVLEAVAATLDACTVANNATGVVMTGPGAPRIERCTFEHQSVAHLSIEGESAPVVGGSASGANRFLGSTSPRLRTSATTPVAATHNFWDDPCAPRELFVTLGPGAVAAAPWMSADLLQSFEDCAAASAYHETWLSRQGPGASGTRGSRKAE